MKSKFYNLPNGLIFEIVWTDVKTNRARPVGYIFDKESRVIDFETHGAKYDPYKMEILTPFCFIMNRPFKQDKPCLLCRQIIRDVDLVSFRKVFELAVKFN